jgi:hypothetical protein
MKRSFLGAATLGVVATALTLISAGAAAITTGTWEQYPTGVTEYQAAVQAPINPDKSSNWSSKSKGAIPVMFKLSSRIGPAAFESIGSDANTANDYAFVSFTPDPSITFNDIAILKTDYTFTLGDCHGGSLRWSVRTSPSQSVFIYYGAAPQFGNGGVNGCTPTSPLGVTQSGTNMIGLSDLRYDTSQYAGGTFYDTYAHAKELVGTAPIIRASLVIDSGWGGDQRLDVSNTTVNDNVYQFVSSAGSFAPTCDLPPATLKITKISGTETGPVNEEPVQASLVDSGTQFRVVDCKYQYILSIPSLRGIGNYLAEIQIDGTTVGSASFDLK